ncbi:hypothetical protein KIW84_074748 [Lathyrus oleraceus]|uniref:Calponin-homology (CH) domain-containing protein n=1 Tax=Pisum sativum TaxID=3888 RepID=A0A9D4ZYJ2_PEA|nr:hypothetical protein KIW84_074748 [Pisum sativum]
MAGRRLRDAVKTVLSGDKSFGSNTHVVIAGLTNAYSQYVTTYEELRIIKGDNADLQDAKNSYHYRDDVQRSPRAFMLSNDFNMKNDSLAQDKPLKQRLGQEGRLRDDRGNHQDHERNGRINGDKPDSPFHERAAMMMTMQGLGSNDFYAQTSREERCFRLWINSLGIVTYVNNVFEDVRNGWVLLEVLDKVSPGSVNWKQATKPPIKMPFQKVENCNQVIKIGKDLNFCLVNVAGNDIVQGNKKLLLAFLWQLMRFTMLQLLRNLRSHSQGKEITDADILNWANNKVKKAGRTSQMESFKDKNISNGIFFLELLSTVEPRVVNWTLVTKGETDDDKKLNSTYILSVARKIGCSIFLLPEDIIEVNQKMILTLSASIMYWSLQNSEENSPEASPVASADGEHEIDLVNEEACSSASIDRLKNLNRKTVDVIASRLYFYYSYSYELTGDLAEIRGNLFQLHRIATLRHDELGQETLLNLLLRNYLHYNLYDQAEKLRSKAPRFEAHSNQQFCRYLFYLGKIQTIQLEYTDAKESLLQAARKTPVAAQGFQIQCNKGAIIVR